MNAADYRKGECSIANIGVAIPGGQSGGGETEVILSDGSVSADADVATVRDGMSQNPCFNSDSGSVHSGDDRASYSDGSDFTGSWHSEVSGDFADSSHEGDNIVDESQWQEVGDGISQSASFNGDGTSVHSGADSDDEGRYDEHGSRPLEVDINDVSLTQSETYSKQDEDDFSENLHGSMSSDSDHSAKGGESLAEQKDEHCEQAPNLIQAVPTAGMGTHEEDGSEDLDSISVPLFQASGDEQHISPAATTASVDSLNETHATAVTAAASDEKTVIEQNALAPSHSSFISHVELVEDEEGGCETETELPMVSLYGSTTTGFNDNEKAAHLDVDSEIYHSSTDGSSLLQTADVDSREGSIPFHHSSNHNVDSSSWSPGEAHENDIETATVSTPDEVRTDDDESFEERSWDNEQDVNHTEQWDDDQESEEDNDDRFDNNSWSDGYGVTRTALSRISESDHESGGDTIDSQSESDKEEWAGNQNGYRFDEYDDDDGDDDSDYSDANMGGMLMRRFSQVSADSESKRHSDIDVSDDASSFSSKIYRPDDRSGHSTGLSSDDLNLARSAYNVDGSEDSDDFYGSDEFSVDSQGERYPRRSYHDDDSVSYSSENGSHSPRSHDSERYDDGDDHSSHHSSERSTEPQRRPGMLDRLFARRVPSETNETEGEHRQADTHTIYSMD